MNKLLGAIGIGSNLTIKDDTSQEVIENYNEQIKEYQSSIDKIDSKINKNQKELGKIAKEYEKNVDHINTLSSGELYGYFSDRYN